MKILFWYFIFSEKNVFIIIRELKFDNHLKTCREHFEQNTRDLDEKVKTNEDGVLFLWRIHNSVNSRVSGSATDDPLYPKIQWPSEHLCPVWGQTFLNIVSMKWFTTLNYKFERLLRLWQVRWKFSPISFKSLSWE